MSGSVRCTSALHAALKADPVAWQSLQLVGYQPTETDDGQPAKLELKNCAHCESTLAVEVTL